MGEENSEDVEEVKEAMESPEVKAILGEALEKGIEAVGLSKEDMMRMAKDGPQITGALQQLLAFLDQINRNLLKVLGVFLTPEEYRRALETGNVEIGIVRGILDRLERQARKRK